MGIVGIAERNSHGRIMASLWNEELGKLIIAVRFQEADPIILETLFLPALNVTGVMVI